MKKHHDRWNILKCTKYILKSSVDLKLSIVDVQVLVFEYNREQNRVLVCIIKIHDVLYVEYTYLRTSIDFPFSPCFLTASNKWSRQCCIKGTIWNQTHCSYKL